MVMKLMLNDHDKEDDDFGVNSTAFLVRKPKLRDILRYKTSFLYYLNFIMFRTFRSLHITIQNSKQTEIGQGNRV